MRYACAVLAAGLLATASAGTACHSSSAHKQPTASPAGLTAVAGFDGAIAPLIAPPDQAAFEVMFDWPSGPPGGETGMFAWRQTNGTRRLDAEWGPDKTPHGLSLITHTSDDPNDLRRRVCAWGLELKVDTQLSISCELAASTSMIFNSFVAMEYTRDARIDGTATIAGRAASCYAFVLYSGTARLCIDDELRAPLSFDGFDNDGYHEHVEAVEVTTTVTPFTAMDEFPDSPQPRPTVTVAALSLPKALADRLAQFSNP